MELRLQEQSIYLVVLLMLASSTTKAANVVDVGGKSLSRGTDKGMAYATFKAHTFSYLNITSIGSDMVAKGSECGLACVNIPSCFSFNLAAFFDINTGRILCELLPSDKYNNSQKFVASQFHHHYSITSPCGSSPCQNNGMCAAQYEKNSYACVCAKGYTGKYCEMDIDECASNPCLNNGTCTDLVDGFNCSCAPGFQGTRCEIDIDECASQPCLNNGACTDLVNGFKCSCVPGYNGIQCERDIIECASNPCLNNGTCTDLVNGFYCSCGPGFQGTRCEIDIDECASNPCLNSGTCNDLVNGFKCNCKPTFRGTRCDIYIGIKKNCGDWYKSGKTISGVYTIFPDGSGGFNVFCDQTTDGGGWTVFQKRLDDSVDFFRGWADYKLGFGNLNGEFWLGLDKIHRLTSSKKYKLRVDLEDMSGNTAYAEYDLFVVGSEGTKYQLSLGSYTGTAGDSLTYHNGFPFTTKDQDNDSDHANCAAYFEGAWWYDSCYDSNLNGPYRPGQYSGGDVIRWKTLSSHSAKRAEMKIRPVDF